MNNLMQDAAAMDAKGQIDVTAQLTRAARESGRNPLAIAWDFFRLRKKRGKLKLYEFILYELFDKSRWTDDEREAFVSAHIHWPLVNACNDRNWWSVTEDKWLSSVFLEQNGVPIPDTLAVFDRSVRDYGKTRVLKTSADLKNFLSAKGRLPVFIKPIGGMWSAGAMRISGVTDTHAVIDGQNDLSFVELADQAIGDNPYILQECLKPHSFFNGLTDAIATVRCLNIIDDDGLKSPFTLLKLPQGSNTADNFWRSGNLLCTLDPESGKITGIVKAEDGRRQELDALPDNERALVGETLPHWDALKELNRKVALLHAANHFGSTDIALTEEGPVIVEVNNGCAFELMQIATGKGFLTDDMAEFFRKHGVKL